MRLIDGDNFGNRMYHEAFEKDSDMQKWDSGCWIRYRLFENVLREQPTVTPEPHWIPVTERLPNDDTEVIVSCTDDSGDGKFSYVTTGWHFKGMWIVNNERCFFVRAWQPLPEKPYREEEQDES